MVDSRRKGNQFMLRLCYLLSGWWAQDQIKGKKADGLPFRTRSTSITPIEGHWQGKGDILHRPDITIPFPFSVEAKHYKSWNFSNVFNPKCLVFDWWRQNRAQAAVAGEHPLLLCAANATPIYAILAKETYQCLSVRSQEQVLQFDTPNGSVAALLWTSLASLPPAEVAAALGPPQILPKVRRSSLLTPSKKQPPVRS